MLPEENTPFWKRLITGLQENIFAFENGQALIFSRQAWNKLWFWWVGYQLRPVISNPRRNVEFTMGRIKFKQSTSFYA